MHPTERASDPSRAGAFTDPITLDRLILAVAFTMRHAGVALVARGEIVHLWSRWLHQIAGRPEAWATALVREYPITTVALDGAAQHALPGAAIAAALEAAALSAGVPVRHVGRADVARVLDIERATNAAIRRELVAREPFLARRLRPRSDGVGRSASERYYEPAFVAVGVALAAHQVIASRGSVTPTAET